MISKDKGLLRPLWHAPRKTLIVLMSSALAVLAFTATPALAAGDANQASCPAATEESPGFRSTLPDCRAYEQVSPVFKDGSMFIPDNLSVSGSRLIAHSLGLVAGTTGPFCFTHPYSLSRLTTGWSTTPVADAPKADFVYATSCMPTPVNDEGTAIVEMRPLSHSVYELDLYRREPNGTFTLIGPMRPPSAVPPLPVGGVEELPGSLPIGNFSNELIGASADFSHVLFTLAPRGASLPPGVTSELWPGDTTHLAEGETQRASLYEYVGTGNGAPALVGVDNAGQLISECGTELGGGASIGNRGNHRNAISADGSLVFFTAQGANTGGAECAGAVEPPVEEVFARIDNGEPGARSLAISEPNALPEAPPNPGCTTPECEANTTEEANFRGANFEGASTDGSKAFFTSPQQLLDGATQDNAPEDRAVGGIGSNGCEETVGANGCNLYEYEFTGPTEGHLVLLSGGDSSGLGPQVQGVAAISEDGSHVYFVAKGVLTKEPRGGVGGSCLDELSPPELAEEETTEEGRCRPKREADNLYVKDTTTAKTTFIATLGPQDRQQWPAAGEGEEGAPMNVTDDGGFLAFTTAERLTQDETSENAVPQVFRYEAATGALVRISVGEEGFNQDGNATVGNNQLAAPATNQTQATSLDRHPALSENGAAVAFLSSERLTPEALENRCGVEEEGECVALAFNVYEYREGHVYLISDGRDATRRAPTAIISPSGSDVFFTTVDSLVPQDADTLRDVYDARAAGGFPAPPPTTACEGEACQRQSAAPPAGQSPASASFSGPGNQKPRHAHKHRKRRHPKHRRAREHRGGRR